jgi:taurine dioxygenase
MRLHEKGDSRMETCVYPLHPTIGAEVDGIDLRTVMDEETRHKIIDLVLKYKVIFFRNQVLNHKQFVDFGKTLGRLKLFSSDEDECFDKEGYPEIIKIYSYPDRPPEVVATNHWHSDGSFYDPPMMATIIRAIEIPPVGGDTLFADMEFAYEALPEPIKSKINKLVAEHNYGRVYCKDMSDIERKAVEEKLPPCDRPVVRILPENGKKSLFVNRLFTTRIKGLPAQESDELLDYLFQQPYIPEYQIRFRWQPHSIAIWDNRRVQHYASSDYWPAPRRLEAMFIEGLRW